MRKAIVSVMLILSACTATTAKPEPATAPPSHDPALVSRFANVIWPTILTYRNYGQGDPQSPPGPDSGMAKFNSVVDPATQSGSVKQEAQNIGELVDAKGVSTGDTDHLALATTTISSLTATDANVIACYTYDFTARSDWPHTNDRAVPGAAEVTFALRKANDWLVHSISNNHTVSGCSTNRA